MKTKHIFITLFAMLAAFLATSCTDKDSLTGIEAPGSTRTLSFNLTTDAQAQTRATAPVVAGHKVQYILQVLNADGTNFDFGSGVTQQVNETGTFEVELPVGVEYTCLFWAQYIPSTGGSTSKYFTTDDLKAVTLKDVLTADEQCQAFCATADVTANQAEATNTVTLKRAVAQVNLRSNEDLKYYNKIEATYSDVPNVFNVKDNTVSTSGAAGVPSTFSITDTDISADPSDSKFTFHSVYFLAQGDGNANLLKIELKTYNEGDTSPIQTLSVPNVPTKKNYKTNVTATLDAASFTHNFTFDYAEWETDELEPDRTLWDGTTPAPNAAYPFGGGDGNSESTAYIIASAADFAQLMANVNAGTAYANKYFKLTTDLNLNNHEWTPIGTDPNAFKGNFNGQFHTISGLKIDNSSVKKYVGLFGYVKREGSSTICGISNLHVSGNVKNTKEGSTGGICGSAQPHVTLKNCSFEGSVEAIAGSVGGICGGASGLISACKNSATVTNTKTDGSTGGISGNGMSATFYGCYNEGTITGKNKVGGITGNLDFSDADIKGCYNIGIINNTDEPTKTGAIAGSDSNNHATGDCYVVQSYGATLSGSYEKVFSNSVWPTSTGTWTVAPSPDGSTDKYWKSLGGWNSGGNTIEYPKLWWEE